MVGWHFLFIFAAYMTNPITLYQLNRLVRGVIESTLDEEYWVIGEFSEAREGYGGHLYAELVQKDEDGRSILAKARVNCWARQYQMLRLRFMQETGEEIRAGLQVLALVRVTFHEQYGYALQLLDIDSSYTLGDMARRRQEILRQLQEDGVLHDNQQLELPRLTNRIAVISSASAAGYGDFCNQLIHNEYGLHFTLQLFPAVMQGQHVEESIVAALECIAEAWQDWDAVVIIRGGGATADLSDFDSYPLASCIAQFPLPVITGIGHDRDQTVLDVVAHTSVKTPTAAAAFLVEHQLGEASLLEQLQYAITDGVRQRMQLQHQRLERLSATIPLSFARVRERNEYRLDALWQRMAVSSRARITDAGHRLQLQEQRLTMLDPARLLRLGYSITTVGGNIVRTASDVKEGDIIETRTRDTVITSKVINKS